MSTVETIRRPSDKSGVDAIHVRRVVARQIETRSQLYENVTVNAEVRARALEHRATAALRSSSYHLVLHVSCEVTEEVLILRGCVPSFYLKQMAQTIVLDLLSEGLVIDNQVEVDWS